MKKFTKFLAIFLLISLIVSAFVGCEFPPKQTTGNGEEIEFIDYVDQLKLDMNSSTLKWEVTLKMHIDGDTSHFHIKNSGNINGIDKTPGIDGVLKARYVGINTPESTGKIEPWGKKASNFTKSKLENAESIIIESEDANWNVDSTGERFLVWVWYKAPGASDYRNLNLEILQEGLAVSSKSADSMYGEICAKVIDQAAKRAMYVYAPLSVKDPDYPYGEGKEVTIKELKTNIESYLGYRVAFEGVIVKNNEGEVFVEAYDPETNMYYGISAFYANSGLDGYGKRMLAVGNKLRFVGVITEFGGSYQLTDLKYDIWNPEDPNAINFISEGHEAAYQEITFKHFDYHTNEGIVSVEVEVDGEVTIKEIPFMFLAQASSVSMKNLKVVEVYTTKKGDSAGAMTLTCNVLDENGNAIKYDGKTVTVDVRTIVLRDANGQLITESTFKGKIIDVFGTIDYFDLENTGNGTYQIQLYSINDVTFHN